MNAPGRTASPAGQLPRSLHAIIEQAARPVPCPYCGCKPGRACTGLDGFHVGRFVRAAVQGLMASAEFPTVLGGLDVFTNATIIRGGQR